MILNLVNSLNCIPIALLFIQNFVETLIFQLSWRRFFGFNVFKVGFHVLILQNTVQISFFDAGLHLYLQK